MERAAELFSASDDELGGFKARARAVGRMSGKSIMPQSHVVMSGQMAPGATAWFSTACG
jgi:hypothetical protein